MVGQRLAMGRPFGLLVLSPRTLLFFAGEIAVEILKPERQLIGIKAFGTATELRALQLFDDRYRGRGDAEVLYLSGDCRGRAACSILLEHADSKKRLRLI
jgi:hypothetical protein